MPDGTEKLGTLAERRERLLAALATLREGPTVPPRLAWLNSWRGIGAILDGMSAQGYDVELMQQPHGWWARFYLSSASHPVCAGSGWAVEPWRAVQAAAWETLGAMHQLGHPDRNDASSEDPPTARAAHRAGRSISRRSRASSGAVVAES